MTWPTCPVPRFLIERDPSLVAVHDAFEAQDRRALSLLVGLPAILLQHASQSTTRWPSAHQVRTPQGLVGTRAAVLAIDAYGHLVVASCCPVRVYHGEVSSLLFCYDADLDLWRESYRTAWRSVSAVLVVGSDDVDLVLDVLDHVVD